jgi:hypothetical protein
MRHFGHAKTYTMRDTTIFENLIEVNTFLLSLPHIRILVGPYFHCCLLLLVYTIHLLDGGPTLEMGPMDLQVEERSKIVDAPPDHNSCHNIEKWYAMKPLQYCTNTYIFVDEHARWKHSLHNNFASYAWIDSHYDCLVASCISMSSMIYKLVHFLSKFVVIYIDGIFIHNVHIAHHQLHDNIIILSTTYHVHAIDTPSLYGTILHNGRNVNTFVCTTNEFALMNALHLILYHLAKLHAPWHEQSSRTNSCLLDEHLVCANHCISKCTVCLLLLHVYRLGDTREHLDHTMTCTPSYYKSVYDNRFHGDEVFDPRTDLSQGGGR